MLDKNKLRSQFENPPRTFRVSPMTHGWAVDYRAQMDQGIAYGYGGAVTNVPFANGFTSNPANIEKFRDILAAMDEKGLEFWIYPQILPSRTSPASGSKVHRRRSPMGTVS